MTRHLSLLRHSQRAMLLGSRVVGAGVILLCRAASPLSLCLALRSGDTQFHPDKWRVITTQCPEPIQPRP